MQDLNDNIPELKIEFMADGMGDGLILLEQDSCGNIDRVAIHPIHLRYMAEKMGLVETSDPSAHKTIAMLTRRLQLLNHRIQHLDNWLRNYSDSKHADLTYEQTYSGGTADMATEFCIELDDSGLQETAPTQTVEPAPVPPANPAPKVSVKPTPSQASLV
jgi:hypothetical protein